MLNLFVAWFLSSASTTSSDIAALTLFDVHDLSADTAQQHLIDARIAGHLYNVDPDLVLAVAWHESRFTIAVTHEHDGLTSCGVMTPEPLQTCTSHSVLEGYLAGAAHLRHWIDASQGDVHRALMGYAGGYRFIANCARGPRLRSTGIHDDLCRVADIELAVAARIKRLRDRGHTV